MGARLSRPLSADGLSEAPSASPTTKSSAGSSPSTRKGIPPPSSTASARRIWSSRQVVAPLAAFSMACVLLVYTRTSIKVAKANAQRHRDADSGGTGLDLLSESRRRHGLERRVEEEGGTVGQLARGARAQILGPAAAGGTKTSAAAGQEGGKGQVAGARKAGESEDEGKLREAMGARRREGS